MLRHQLVRADFDLGLVLDIDRRIAGQPRSHEKRDIVPRVCARLCRRAYLMLSAPQLGVRHARRLVGVGRVTREDWPDGAPRAGEIGISPSLSPKFPLLSVPYGCLVPRDIDGLLVAGRHISSDATSHSFLREIPQCWLTGQAAGAAAALVAAERCEPRAVPTAALQALLRRQRVVLRQVGETAATAS